MKLKVFKHSTLWLILAGVFVPLLCSLLLSLLVYSFPKISVPVVAVPLSIVFLLIWACCALFLSDPGKGAVTQSLLMCAPGLVMLCLVLIQEVLGRYWFSFVGVLSQDYFTPVLSLIASVFRLFKLYFLLNLPFLYVLSLLIMFAVSFFSVRGRKGARFPGGETPPSEA